MADRFDELMRNVADSADKSVDYQAMHDAVLLEAKKRQKNRLDLTRTLSAAAVFVFAVSVGLIALSAGKDAPAENAVAMTAMYDSAEGESAEEIYFEEDLDSLTADDTAIIQGCTPETCDVPAEESAAQESASGAAEPGDMGVKDRSADPAQIAAEILALSWGQFYTIGAPDFSSCAAICFIGAEVLGDCRYNTIECDERVLDIGQAYILSREGYDGGEGLIGLWQILDDEYVLVECPDPSMTPGGLAQILRGMAEPE